MSTEIASLLLAIKTAADTRFVSSSQGDLVDRIRHVAPDGLVCDAVLLTRTGRASPSRIVLITSCRGEDISKAASWSASVRDLIPASQIADLYLFLLIDGITDDEVIRVESDESFCRKYAARPSDDPVRILERTFLASLQEQSALTVGADPLGTALAEVGSANAWFDSDVQTAWRDLLLSYRSGLDLASELVQVGATDL